MPVACGNVLATAIVMLTATFFVIYAYRKRKIDKYGLLGAVAVGITVFLTVGCVGIIALLAFFLFGNLITKYKFEEKERMGVAEAQKGKRSLGNVLGNGLSPSLFGILYAFSQHPLFLLGFSGAVATACADTFATEIGQALCKKPRLITNLRRVPVGTNGGVSLAGLCAAFLGSSLISVVSFLSLLSAHSEFFATATSQNTATTATTTASAAPLTAPVTLLICTLSGFFGCIADSFLGATLENRNKLNNHEVNALATLSGGIFALALGKFLM